jgi:hypothetical protein
VSVNNALLGIFSTGTDVFAPAEECPQICTSCRGYKKPCGGDAPQNKEGSEIADRESDGEKGD